MGLKKVYAITLGCSKNEIDSELMLSMLKNNDYIVADTLDEAEVIIVKYMWLYRKG